MKAWFAIPLWQRVLAALEDRWVELETQRETGAI